MSQSAIFDALQVAADFYPRETELGPVGDERQWDQAIAEVEQLGAWDFASYRKPSGYVSEAALDAMLRAYYTPQQIAKISAKRNPFLSMLSNAVADPNCPPGRAYIFPTIGQMAERMAKVGGKPRHLFMHPRTYADLMKREEEREVRARVEARVGLRESLYRALGLGTFFQGAVA